MTTFSELEATALPGDTAMMKVTRNDEGGWTTPWGSNVTAQYSLRNVEAHNYAQKDRVMALRVMRVRRADARAGDWAVSKDSKLLLNETDLHQMRTRNAFVDDCWHFERVLSEVEE